LIKDSWRRCSIRTSIFAFYATREKLAEQPCGAFLRTMASVAKDPGSAYCIEGGVERYIETVHKNLRTTAVRINAPVAAVKYTGPGPLGWQVTGADGTRQNYDQIIFALWPCQVADILRQGLASGGHVAASQSAVESRTAETAAVLAKVELGYCRVVIHNDAGLMPFDRRSWSTYTYKNLPGLKAGLATVWSGQVDEVEVFTSYDWTNNPDELSDTSALTRPRGRIHGVVTPVRTPPRMALCEAQAHLGARQGQDGLWFTGSFMRATGYHEDALASSIDIVKRLVPDYSKLERLQHLLTRVPAGSDDR
jgi:predicted NAD/FAD-binding protein